MHLLSRISPKKAFVVTPRNQDYLEIVNVVQNTIQSAINPLISKINAIDEKVNELRQDRVTRTEFTSTIESLRKEVMGSMVPRDAYEPRHAALIERDAQLEASMRDLRRDFQEDMKNMQAQYQSDLKYIHERLESGKKQFEDRMDDIEAKIDKEREAVLSTQDRFWVRFSQVTGVLAIVIALLEFLMAHVHFN